MVPDPSEIVLRIASGEFDGLVDWEERKPFEALHPFAVFRGVLG